MEKVYNDKSRELIIERLRNTEKYIITSLKINPDFDAWGHLVKKARRLHMSNPKNVDFEDVALVIEEMRFRLNLKIYQK
ncbi:hypothetical protein ACOLNO_003784 [Vibrio parahaemolyticus]